jgi:hypothetical protein
MPDVNVVAVVVATIAGFVLSSAYYTVVGKQLAEVSDAAAAGGQPPPWKLAVELLRSLVVAAVLAGPATLRSSSSAISAGSPRVEALVLEGPGGLSMTPRSL